MTMDCNVPFTGRRGETALLVDDRILLPCLACAQQEIRRVSVTLRRLRFSKAHTPILVYLKIPKRGCCGVLLVALAARGTFALGFESILDYCVVCSTSCRKKEMKSESTSRRLKNWKRITSPRIRPVPVMISFSIT